MCDLDSELVVLCVSISVTQTIPLELDIFINLIRASAILLTLSDRCSEVGSCVA